MGAWAHWCGAKAARAVAVLSLCLVPALAPAAPRTVRVGVYENAPKVFVSTEGKPAGIFVDVIEAVAAREGWRVEYVPGSWAEGLQRLSRRELDLMPDVAFTADREALYSFHQTPVLSAWEQVYAGRREGIHSILDLNGRRVATLEGSVQQEELRRLAHGYGLQVTVVPVATYEQAFALVARHEADAVVANNYYGARHFRAHGLEDTAVLFNPSALFFAAPKGGDQELLAALDRHLVALRGDPRSAYYASIKRWTGEGARVVWPAWLGAAALAFGLVIVVSLAWAVGLRRQVRARTRALTEQYAQVRDVNRALQDSERKLRMLFETAGDAILLMREDRFIDCNKRALELYGTIRERLVGAPPYRYSPPQQPDGLDSRAKALEKIERAVTSGPQFFEWVHCREDRTEFDAEVSLNRLEVGGEVLLQAIVRDVTKRKRSEEALRRSESTLRGVFEAAPVGICVMKDRTFASANKFWCESFGYPERSLVGKSPRFLYESDDEYDRVGQELYAHMKERGVAATETRFRCGDGSWRDVILTVAPLHRDDLAAGTLAIIHDITERKQAEATLEEFAHQLRELSAHIEAAREAERTGIAREIHDQLGQALTVLKMDLSWIARRASSEAGLAREQLLEKVKALVQMTDETIDEVRRISAELRPGILDQVGLGAALAWKAKELEKRTQLACLVDSTLPPEAKLDRALSTAVFRVFQEALTNVVRHAEATRVDVVLAAREGALVLEVRDDGRGITPEQIDDPHSLGLLGIRERLRPFGGTIAFARAEPKGTVVTVRVPLEAGGRGPDAGG